MINKEKFKGKFKMRKNFVMLNYLKMLKRKRKKQEIILKKKLKWSGGYRMK